VLRIVNLEKATNVNVGLLRLDRALASARANGCRSQADSRIWLQRRGGRLREEVWMALDRFSETATLQTSFRGKISVFRTRQVGRW